MNFTENALNQFKKLIYENENKNPTLGIRFFTVQGCCSPSLQMELAKNQNQDDKVHQIDDVTFFVTPEAEQILSEITIDYSNNSFRSIKNGNKPAANKCC